MKVWKVILAALVLFLAGLVSGALAQQLYLAKTRRPAIAFPGGPPAPWLRQRVEFMHRLGNRLSLTPEQRARIDALVLESQQRLRILWAPVEPEAKEELHRLRRRIAAELRPEQRAKFETLLRERFPRRPAEASPDILRDSRDGRGERPRPHGAPPNPNRDTNPTPPAPQRGEARAPRGP